MLETSLSEADSQDAVFRQEEVSGRISQLFKTDTHRTSTARTASSTLGTLIDAFFASMAHCDVGALGMNSICRVDEVRHCTKEATALLPRGLCESVPTFGSIVQALRKRRRLACSPREGSLLSIAVHCVQERCWRVLCNLLSLRNVYKFEFL